MNGVLAVYEKEIRHYFRSPIAYFVIAVFLVGTGYFYTYNVFLGGTATMDETFQNMGILLTVVCPAISMRMFSGEWSDKTMELLQTLPLKSWQVVAGKFLGALTMLALMAIGTMIDLIPMYMFAEPETMTIIAGYIGFFLLGMACLALGQFFSVLTENQIVAALITVAVLLGFWFIGNLQSFQSSYFLWNLFGFLSFSGHYGQFIQGLVSTDAVAYYAVVSLIALSLNTAYLQWRR
jgi:ABC-2 type transport system permease protein